MASLTELRAELEALDGQIRALHQTDDGELREFTPAQQKRFDALMAERDEVAQSISRHEDIVRATQDPARVVEPNAGVRRTSGPGSAERDAAARVIDAAFRSSKLPDHAAEKATALIDEGREADRRLAARWAAATGSPAYARAFFKLLADPERGHLLWDREEQAAYQRVAEVQSEMRGMSLTDNAGGYMVPLTLDPSIILTGDGSINPLRRVSRVVQTVTDTWQGVTSAGVTAEWTDEAAEMADATPTLAGPSIPVHKGDAFVPFSFEVGMDAVNFEQDLARLLVDGADQLQATAYTTGSGTGQPTGIITALAGGSSEVAPTVAESFSAADVYKLIEAVPPRFRARASWQANLSVLNLLDQFETTNGAKKFPELDNDRLLRRAVNENSNMDGTYNAAATADNYLLLCGDFSNYVIADRIGTQVELARHLYGANGRPNGQRGLIMWFRTGADSVNDAAFALLNVATTA